MKIEKIEHILRDKRLCKIHEDFYVPVSLRVINCVPAVAAFDAAIDCIQKAKQGEKLNLTRYDKRYKNPLHLNIQIIAALIFLILKSKKRLSLSQKTLMYEAFEHVTYGDFKLHLGSYGKDIADGYKTESCSNKVAHDAAMEMKYSIRRMIEENGQKFLDDSGASLEQVAVVNQFMNAAWSEMHWSFRNIPKSQATQNYFQDIHDNTTVNT